MELLRPEAKLVLVVHPQAFVEAEVEDAAALLLEERLGLGVADGRRRRGHRHEEVATVPLGDTEGTSLSHQKPKISTRVSRLLED